MKEESGPWELGKERSFITTKKKLKRIQIKSEIYSATRRLNRTNLKITLIKKDQKINKTFSYFFSVKDVERRTERRREKFLNTNELKHINDHKITKNKY